MEDLLAEEWETLEILSDIAFCGHESYSKKKYNSGIIDFHLKNKKTGKIKFACIFFASNLEGEIDQKIIVRDKNEKWWNEWNKTSYVSSVNVFFKSKENKLIEKKIEEELSAIDFNEEDFYLFIQGQREFVDFSLIRKKESISMKDLEAAKTLVSQLEEILNKKVVYRTADIYENLLTSEEVVVSPSFYAEAGIPIDEDGDDMRFLRTEVTPYYKDDLEKISLDLQLKEVHDS